MTKCYECKIDDCKNPEDVEGGLRDSVCPDGYYQKVVCQHSKDCKDRSICIHGIPHDPYTIQERWEIRSGSCNNQGGICGSKMFKCI